MPPEGQTAAKLEPSKGLDENETFTNIHENKSKIKSIQNESNSPQDAVHLICQFNYNFHDIYILLFRNTKSVNYVNICMSWDRKLLSYMVNTCNLISYSNLVTFN